jgi:hypothetical protein
MAEFIRYWFKCPECGHLNGGTTRGEGVSSILCARNEYAHRCSGRVPVKKSWRYLAPAVKGYEVAAVVRVYQNGMAETIPVGTSR